MKKTPVLRIALAAVIYYRTNLRGDPSRITLESGNGTSIPSVAYTRIK